MGSSKVMILRHSNRNMSNYDILKRLFFGEKKEGQEEDDDDFVIIGVNFKEGENGEMEPDIPDRGRNDESPLIIPSNFTQDNNLCAPPPVASMNDSGMLSSSPSDDNRESTPLVRRRNKKIKRRGNLNNDCRESLESQDDSSRMVSSEVLVPSPSADQRAFSYSSVENYSGLVA